MSMKYSSKYLLAKIETVSGTKEPLDGADVVLTTDLSAVVYDGDTVSPQYDGSDGRVVPNIRTNAHTTMAFNVDFAGSGTAGEAPAYGKLLQICGFEETPDDPTTPTEVVYTLAHGSSPTATLAFVRQGQVYEEFGARGEVGLALDNGLLKLQFSNVKGAYETPAAFAQVPLNYGHQAPAVPVGADNTTVATLDGVDLCLSDFSLANLGNTVSKKDFINCTAANLVAAPITGSLTILADDISVRNWFEKAETKNGVVGVPFVLENGTVSGNIVRIEIPNAQISNVQETDLDGVLGYTMDLNALDGGVILTVK